MDLLELIHRDHDEIARLLDQLAGLARARPDTAVQLATQLVIAVRVHALAEERVLYPLVTSRLPNLRSFALSAPQLHENLDTTIDKLLVPVPGDELATLVGVAHDLFELHARDEEEGEVLPVLRERLSREELATLAGALAAEKARLRPRVERAAGSPARAA